MDEEIEQNDIELINFIEQLHTNYLDDVEERYEDDKLIDDIELLIKSESKFSNCLFCSFRFLALSFDIIKSQIYCFSTSRAPIIPRFAYWNGVKHNIIYDYSIEFLNSANFQLITSIFKFDFTYNNGTLYCKLRVYKSKNNE